MRGSRRGGREREREKGRRKKKTKLAGPNWTDELASPIFLPLTTATMGRQSSSARSRGLS